MNQPTRKQNAIMQNDAIVDRYIKALTKNGDMYSRETVGIVLALACDEAAAIAIQDWEHATEVEVGQLRGQLAEISRLNVDLEKRRQDWQREAEEQRAAASSSFTKLDDLRAWLVANYLPAEDDIVEAAIGALVTQQDEIAALGAANATLHQQLATAKSRYVLDVGSGGAQLAAAHADELGAVQAIIAQGGANGNGAAPEPAVKHRRRRASASDGSDRLTKAETRTLAFTLIRNYNHEHGRPPKMSEFDAVRPADKIATGEAVMKRLGMTSWMALVSAALAEPVEAVA